MQGKVSMATISDFMPVFFRELQRDGQIDRAVSVARGGVRHRPDHWMPALYLRLKSGRIWYVPGFGEAEDGFEKFQSLAGSIQEQTCTPIVGPGMIENLFGPRREIANRWAEEHGFPLSPASRDVLPSVAQYVVTRQSSSYLPVAIREALRMATMHRFAENIPEDLQQAKAWSTPQ